MNVTNPRERYTAANYLHLMSAEQLEADLSTIFSKLRNTEQYWRRPRSDLRCMSQHYGPETWFLTLSPSEWLWSDLAEYIREVNASFMRQMSLSELVAADPVSTSRFIDNKFRAMLDFITSSDNPLGEVTHYFWRREYQGRGIQHFHLLIWIKDAPTLGESSAAEVAKFILKYVTCAMPNINVSPLLHRRITMHQQHTHNSYCMRTKKSKYGKTTRVCRFGFPRPTTDTLVLRDVAVSIAGRRQLKQRSRLYDLPRKDTEVNINDYNLTILTAWEGNMDIQFIGEKSTLLNLYCTKYTTKCESSCGFEIFDAINSTKSLCSRLWNVALRSLTNRECGALEASDTLLGISLYGTDRDTTIKWLDVNQIRSRRLKTLSEIKQLNPQSTDIFCPSLIDTHYPNRPQQLENVNLYDFAKFYDFTRIQPTNKLLECYKISPSLYLKRRQRGYLINHYKYNIHIQPERYFFSLLLLFKPWRDLDELKSGCNTYGESFQSLQSQLTDALWYHERLTEIQKAFDSMKEAIQKNISDTALKQRDDGPDNPLAFCPIEADEAMGDLKNINEKLQNVDVAHMISQLNYDQRRIFDTVTSTVHSGRDILRLYVNGEGGTGKTFLIKTIKCWIKQHIGKATAVSAPTGIAAFNVDGLTIHRLSRNSVEYRAKYILCGTNSPEYLYRKPLVLPPRQKKIRLYQSN